MLLRSKIVDYLTEVTKNYHVHFNVGTNINLGVTNAYFIEIYHKDAMERRIYIPPKVIDNDDVDKVRAQIDPFISKYKKEAD